MSKQREEFEDHIRATGVDEYHLAFSDGKYKHLVMQADWCLWQQAQKVAVPDGFVLVEVVDLREIISTASDATMDEKTSSVYNETGEPSTWFDHYTVAEKRVLDMIEAQENST